jgi:hypothetical protein
VLYAAVGSKARRSGWINMKRPLNTTEGKVLESVIALKDIPGKCVSFGTGVDLFIQKLLENCQLKHCDIDRPPDFNDANWEGFRSGFATVRDILAKDHDVGCFYCPIIPASIHNVQEF